LKNDTTQNKAFVFQLAMDNKCVYIAVLKFVLVILLFSLSVIAVRDFTLLTALIIIIGLWFAGDFLIQPQKILLYDDRIVFVGLMEKTNLFYDHIKFINPATVQHTKLLKRKLPGFQFWGKRGWFSSKTIDNVFLYTLSYQINDLVLIKYGIDHYLISVQNQENFIEKINEKRNAKFKR